MNDRIKELSDKIEKLQEQVRRESQEVLLECITEWFSRQEPTLESIEFEGYTIYFNDGDECYYSIYVEDQLVFNEEISMEELPYYSTYDKKWSDYTEEEEENARLLFGDNWKNRMNDEIRNLEQTLHSIPDEVHKQIWGDHQRITITRDGSFSLCDHTFHD
jgi:hypothetical protein